jgi:hypothetical protein
MLVFVFVFVIVIVLQLLRKVKVSKCIRFACKSVLIYAIVHVFWCVGILYAFK